MGVIVYIYIHMHIFQKEVKPTVKTLREKYPEGIILVKNKRNRTTVQENDNSSERNSAEEVTSLMLSKQTSSLTPTGNIKRNRKP